MILSRRVELSRPVHPAVITLLRPQPSPTVIRRRRPQQLYYGYLGATEEAKGRRRLPVTSKSRWPRIVAVGRCSSRRQNLQRAKMPSAPRRTKGPAAADSSLSYCTDSTSFVFIFGGFPSPFCFTVLRPVDVCMEPDGYDYPLWVPITYQQLAEGCWLSLCA